MTIVRLFEMLIPERLRERVHVWLVSRFAAPVKSYFDLRDDLFGRSELLFQTLEQRVIRNEQQLREQLQTELESHREVIRRLERRIAELEDHICSASTGETVDDGAPTSNGLPSS